MAEHIPVLCVFLSSPDNVNDERKAVNEVLDRLSNRPAYRERGRFRVIAWDKPGADTAMLGSPRAAYCFGVNAYHPSGCPCV